MYHKFLVTGMTLREIEGIIPGGQMKSQARKVSHAVPGADDKVGPSLRFERYGKIIERPLTRRESVFGVKAPDDGKSGGFAGLAIWRECPGEDSSVMAVDGEVIIDLVRAKTAKADNWIVDFVRQIILAAGWTIQHEEKHPKSPIEWGLGLE